MKKSNRTSPSRRPRQRLDRRRVIKTALQIVDDEGMGALSMRRLAQALGIQPMSLYTHVANKDDLLDGIVVEVLSEVEIPTAARWEDALRDAFRAYRAALLRHPHAAEIIMRRPARDAERFLSVLESSIGLLRDAGLDAATALHFHRILTSFTTGLVQNEATAPDPRSDPVLLWSQLIGGDQFPNVTDAMPTMLKRDLGETFELGLDIVIDAIKSRCKRSRRGER